MANPKITNPKAATFDREGFISDVDAWLLRNDYTKRSLAIATGVDHAVIYNMFNRKRFPGLDTLTALVAFCDLEFSDYVVQR